MMRWKAICCYDGTDFQGWQSQSSGQGVQDFVEAALYKVYKSPIRIHGAGRTDSGVHANGQVFHFDGEWTHGNERFIQAIQSHLPPSVRILKIDPESDTFHARHSALGKKYVYWWSTEETSPFTYRYCWHIPKEPDYSRIETALSLLRGKQDFTSLAGKVKKGENPCKTIYSSRILPEENRVGLEFIGDGFLYRMVRSLVGTLYRVGIGKLSLMTLEEILANKKRTPDILTAPASGLFLEEVYYD